MTPLVLAASVAFACTPSRSPDAALRFEKLAAERRNLEATFDALEDRLVVNQARVRFWRELRVRHESVAAIACASQDAHAQEMASRAFEPSHRSRVAAVSTAHAERLPAASGTGDGGGSR